MKNLFTLLAFGAAVFAAGCNGGNGGTPDDGPAVVPAPTLSYSIVSVHPHDTSYFTEGLEFYKGTLLESTGLKGQSRLVQMEFPSMKALKTVRLDPSLFGEGITVLNDTLYQLTYQE